MSGNIKQLFKGYLLQLEKIVNKVPPELFSESLTDDMFSLEMNAKIAANFVLRGYYHNKQATHLSKPVISRDWFFDLMNRNYIV